MSSDFPKHWKLLPLEDVMEVIIDYRGKTPKKTVSGIPLITAKIVKAGRILPPSEFIAEEDYDKWMSRGLPKIGDVVVTTEAPLGEVAQLHDSNIALAQRIVTLRGKGGVLNNDFLLCLMQSEFVQHQLDSRATGSTVKGIKQSELRKILLPIPPELEQTEIAKHIISLNQKVELNRQTNQTLETIAQGIFKSWFVDFDPVKAKIAVLKSGGSAADVELAAMSIISSKSLAELAEFKQNNAEAYKQLAQTAALFPSAMHESELGEIPDGWRKGTLEDVLQFNSDRIRVDELNLDNYISTENMLANKTGISQASNLPTVNTVPAFYELDILISNIRPYFKKIWLATFNGGRSADVLGLSSLDKKETEFVYNLVYQDRFFDHMMTTSKGAKMPRGDKVAIMQFDFALPPKIIRELYSRKIRSFYPFIKNANSEMLSLQALRDTLLPKFLSGEINLSELNENISEFKG